MRIGGNKFYKHVCCTQILNAGKSFFKENAHLVSLNAVCTLNCDNYLWSCNKMYIWPEAFSSISYSWPFSAKRNLPLTIILLKGTILFQSTGFSLHVSIFFCVEAIPWHLNSCDFHVLDEEGFLYPVYFDSSINDWSRSCDGAKIQSLSLSLPLALSLSLICMFLW